MPFNGIVPKPVLDALDPPLRALTELGYDRSDYGTPTPAKLFPAVKPVDLTKDLSDATANGVATGLAESGAPVPAVTPSAAPEPDVRKPATPKRPGATASTGTKPTEPVQTALKPLSPVKLPPKNLADRLAGPKKPKQVADLDTDGSTD
jgi:hypothetical protein